MTLTAPEVAPPLLENQGQWAERFAEFEEVSFLEHYPSYKIEDKVYYVSVIISESSKTAQGFMSGIEALSVKFFSGFISRKKALFLKKQGFF